MQPLPEKVRIFACVFSYDRWVHADALIYATRLVEEIRVHPRLDRFQVGNGCGYPCDRIRNAAVKQAKEYGFHYLLMLDNDMRFDALLGADPKAKPFLTSSLDFALAHDGPCCVGAPYTGAPPKQRVMVSRWRSRTPDRPGGEGRSLEDFTREEAALARGIERVASLPTGSLLIDLRVTDILPPPWFHYGFKDEPYNTELIATEDIVFTRNCDWFGIPQYVNWDAWANHHKEYETTKPRLIDPDAIPGAVWKAAQLQKVPEKFRLLNGELQHAAAD